MIGALSSASHQGEPAATLLSPTSGATVGEPMEVECPICYQDYNQYNKCPRMLECLHVFCSECLQRIQLCSCESPDPHSSPPAIPCPLCRHLTPLVSGDTRCLPPNSLILAKLPPVPYGLPVSMASRMVSVTQRVVLSMETRGIDARFIILPTVSLRVQQMHPEQSRGTALCLGGGEMAVIRQHKKTLVCVQVLALVFWVTFVITCVIGVVFGPHFFHK